MARISERIRHRQGALLVDLHATCQAPPGSDYAIDLWYAPHGGEAGSQVETVTIVAGETYGFRSLDGQKMLPFDSEVWLSEPDSGRPAGLAVTIGFDRPTV